MSTGEHFPISRRQVVGAGGIGLAAAAASPAFAQSSNQAAASVVLQDPTSKYPKPPFRRQSQPWPGSRGKWTRGRIMAKSPIAGQGGSPGEKLW